MFNFFVSLKSSNLSTPDRGSILILALWVLSVLSILALGMGLGVRQKITFLSQIDQLSKLRFAAESGVKKSISLLFSDRLNIVEGETAYNKAFRHNNGESFGPFELQDVTVQMKYIFWDGNEVDPVERFGVIDEESKLNVNISSVQSLTQLFKIIFPWEDSRCVQLAEGIIRFRDYGVESSEGFYSQENINTFKKNMEVLNELGFVDGMNEEIFERLSQFLTVYGTGKVNINTVSPPVLSSLGLDEEVIEKILKVRRGEDGLEATDDDFVFLTSHDIVSDLKKSVQLTDEEIAQIDQLNWHQLLDIQSSIYTIQAEGQLKNYSRRKKTVCTIDLSKNKILYWSEK